MRGFAQTEDEPRMTAGTETPWRALAVSISPCPRGRPSTRIDALARELARAFFRAYFVGGRDKPDSGLCSEPALGLDVEGSEALRALGIPPPRKARAGKRIPRIERGLRGSAAVAAKGEPLRGARGSRRPATQGSGKQAAPRAKGRCMHRTIPRAPVLRPANWGNI